MDLAGVVRDLEKFEGRTDYLYQDSRGFVTIGVGNLVATPDDCARLPLYTPHAANGARLSGFMTPATESQKRAAWANVHGCPPGRREMYYANATTVRMLDADIDALAVSRLEHEFLPGLRKLYEGFDDLPHSAQSALVDMIFNLGVAGLAKFHHLQAAVRLRDWQLAALSCHVSTCRKERNDWRAEMLAKAGA